MYRRTLSLKNHRHGGSNDRCHTTRLKTLTTVPDILPARSTLSTDNGTKEKKQPWPKHVNKYFQGTDRANLTFLE